MSSWVPALITGGLALIAALLGATVNYKSQRALAVLAAEQKRETEQLLVRVNAQTAEDAAKREYEYEARKRLYSQVRPLLFQLRESCEPSTLAIRRVVKGELVFDPEHVLTWTRRVFGPLVIAQEIQRHLTAEDLGLDATVRAQYLVAREILLNLHLGSQLADMIPKIDYTPQIGRDAPQIGRDREAGRRRQHFLFEELARLVEFLTVIESDGTRRPMKESELDDLNEAHDQRLRNVLHPMSALFTQANPEATPVLWRLLLAQACFMHILVDLVDRNASQPDALLPSDIEEFNWSGRVDDEYFTSQKMAAKQHVERRLRELELR